MSLLLDALKKAEKAKDDAKRRAQLDGHAEAEDAGQQVRTRDELPDISKPLEIHSEDIGDARSDSGSSSPVPDAFSTAPISRPAPELPKAPVAREPVSEPVQRPRQPSQTAQSGADPQAAQRSAAKKVFEAKFREPNPKLPFYITMAVLGAFSVGTVVYFWYQLRPPPPLVNTNPRPPSDEKASEAPPPSAPRTSAPAAPPAAPAIPGLPGQVQAPVAAAAPPSAGGLAAAAPAGAPSTSGTIPKQRETPAPATAAPPTSRETTGAPARGTGPKPSAANPGSPRTPSGSSNLSVNRRGPIVDPRIETAWQAYNQGDLSTARTNYEAMLRADPSNRDALLGMAAVEIRANRPEQAAGYYQSLLQVNPRDTYAQAGLLALRAQMGDSVQTESRVKNLLAADPDAQVLYFTLGNQYARQGRWAEAQQAYFKAYTAEPENPDFAYNLAVSLDQLRQPKLALEYYRRAMSLAQQHASSFDQTLARNRVQELSR